MLEVAIQTEQRITANEVPAGEQFSFLLRRFDRHHTTVELFLRSFVVELCLDFKGAKWAYFETSTGTVFMVPRGYASLFVCNENNGFQEHVAAETAGLIVSIFVLTRLADVSRSREHMRMAVLLRNYALQHPSATTIFRAID